MNPIDAPPATRRSIRDAAELIADLAAEPGRPVALGWVDDDAVGSRSTRGDLAASAGPYALAHADLLADRPRRSPVRASTTVPLLAVAALTAGTYAAATLMWPLEAVPPVATTVAVTAPIAAPAAPAWPVDGSAATAVDGLGGVAATTTDAASIASITKLVTVLLVLDQMPLAAGEAGPEFSFTAADRREYRDYLADDQSALDVPVGGTLTQYQLLQGVLIASANNYADRLVSEIWPNDEVYARTANAWLEQHGLGGITVADSSGIDPGNAADPASLIALGRAALANPVIADIVRQRTAELPGVGTIENTNALLADPGVVGIKTGSLFGEYNLVAARDADIDGTIVRAYAVVLGQLDDDARHATAAAVLDRTIAEIAETPGLPAGTVAGTVTTPWGASADLRTAGDLRVPLWNTQPAETAAVLDLGDARTAGATAGEFTLTGPLASASTPVTLSADIPDPDAWWRLTHPLELWGLID
ncbi:D-alanyl-D-alanine carboxypeptidase family protein [Microbacterium radiodurans]|uniref:D-alanyl-D-alanine carboxypeptidase family protein n=1 Tax=Microbacterium radiodurans TaxID=661398 RepID=UPI001CC347BB|nr:D-alanyl-D-alanine carboxypeptidase [Microbacterium radiodurans]